VISTSPNLNIIEVLPDWASEIRCLRCPDIDVVKMWRVRPVGATGKHEVNPKVRLAENPGVGP
jgi:hypothetical protein